MEYANANGDYYCSLSMLERVFLSECDENSAMLVKARKNGKLFRDDVRGMDDAEILARLAGIGFKTDKKGIREIASQNPSAEEASEIIIEDNGWILSDNDEDFLWLGIVVLWERWAPDCPSFEMFDDSMQLGYELEAKSIAEAANEWERTWELYKVLAEKWDLNTDQSFDEAFSGTQFISNWIQDFIDVFEDAAGNSKESLLKAASLSGEIFASGMLTNENMRKSFRGFAAQYLIRAGAVEEGDRAFEEAIRDDPHHGWYYVWWADAYSFFKYNKANDYKKALGILERGINAGVTSEEDVLYDRLDGVLKDMGVDPSVMSVEAGLVQEGRGDGAVPRAASTLKEAKVGRNEPCPCGSGKKYKKCCGG
ncbi:MAG: SEC-C metal-binding domain-containing protein [Clostridiales bacterium]|nr:SEC-C metal-binding domain-containing protein [Clostridiales bacterium]